MKLEEYFEIQGTYELVDGVYNVDGNVYLNKQVEILPFKFGKVSGNFYCIDNILTSLEGTPNSVGGHFYCYNNYLTSLNGAPKSVGGDFFCSLNKLTSLKGCPISVCGHFYCYSNKLTSLEGCPTKIGGFFNCDDYLHNNKEYKKYLIIRKLRQ